ATSANAMVGAEPPEPHAGPCRGTSPRKAHPAATDTANHATHPTAGPRRSWRHHKAAVTSSAIVLISQAYISGASRKDASGGAGAGTVGPLLAGAGGPSHRGTGRPCRTQGPTGVIGCQSSGVD